MYKSYRPQLRNGLIIIIISIIITVIATVEFEIYITGKWASWVLFEVFVILFFRVQAGQEVKYSYMNFYMWKE